jgi:hypothetical protein
MQEAWMRPPGVVIAFPDPASRPKRPLIDANERRGEILLFAGVRYDRPSPNPGPSTPFVKDGPGHRRRS